MNRPEYWRIPKNSKTKRNKYSIREVHKVKPPQKITELALSLDLDHLETWASKIYHAIIGAKKSLDDPRIFHKLALIPLLAWIGLGADGLSSSSYGPQEAYITLGPHTYLAILLGLMTAATVMIISYTYSLIIEHFPSGGGGYIVASHNISPRAGVVSGSALLVDYILTITVSIAACVDALFSFLPLSMQVYKVAVGVLFIIFLIILNLRGVKESVLFLAPIFLMFIVFHILLLGVGIGTHLPQIPVVASAMNTDFQTDLAAIGIFGILAIILRAYSYGAGTYTGIEAVANGMQIMREPKVKTGKRTMGYMAISLALVSIGLFVCFLLWSVQPQVGKTLNSVLADLVFGGWAFGGLIAFLVILSEAILLLVAAQTGFIDGPRVMANMAVDSWLPRMFVNLSERLTFYNGIILIGGSAIVLFFFSGGSLAFLVVLYSINVFVTFSLSQYGMTRYFVRNRNKEPSWRKYASVHTIGFIVCTGILTLVVVEKFTSGGWLTLVITAGVVLVCYLIKGHYTKVVQGFHKFDDLLRNIPGIANYNAEPLNPKGKTAIQLVTGYNGFGVRTFFSILQNYPNLYENFIFVTVAVVDSGSFKGASEIEALEEATRKGAQQYVDLARNMGIAAEYRTETGVDVVDTAVELCEEIVRVYHDSTVYTGQIVFRHEHPFQKLLHNETAFAIQRRLQYKGITTVILPIRAEPEKRETINRAVSNGT
jgi:amino acid transporter